MTAPRAARAVLRLAVLMAGAGLAAPAPESGYGLPRDVSVDGFRIDELIHFTLAAITVIFVVVAAALIWSFVNHRRDRPAFYSHGSGRSIGVVVGGVAAILVGVDGYLFVHTLGDMHGYFWNFPRAEAAEGAVRIEVNAHQWSWHARYAGVDGKFGTPDDIAGAIACHRHTRTLLVTAAVDDLQFLHSIKVGDLITHAAGKQLVDVADIATVAQPTPEAPLLLRVVREGNASFVAVTGEAELQFP